MITRHIVSARLLAYLNGELTQGELVDWAENCFITGGFGPDDDIVLVRDVVAYLAGSDSAAFPLTWEACAGFMRRLGTPVKVVPVSS